jgi:predicted AlkP superfamily pyrophosphatase or phosphodiesterase
MLYFHQPDSEAHRSGPDAASVDSVVEELDGLLGALLDGIEALPIAHQIHVMVMSDHGMEAAPASHVVYLDDYVDLEEVRVINNTTQAFLYLDGNEQRLWTFYEALTERLEHATVYIREETPVPWRYRHNRRIGDLVIAAEPGWVLRTRDWSPWSGGGMHGWDPAHRAMQGIFVAAGPQIEPGSRLPAFENVHVYPLAARLLGLVPAPDIDGRLDVFESVLRREPATP